MSGSVHGEGAFEAHIEASLVGGGWVAGSPGNYRRDLGLDTVVLFGFIGATQVEARDRRVLRINFAVSVALILVGVGYLVTHVHHPLGHLVVVPLVFGLVRLVYTLWVLRDRRRVRGG